MFADEEHIRALMEAAMLTRREILLFPNRVYLKFNKKHSEERGKRKPGKEKKERIPQPTG